MSSLIRQWRDAINMHKRARSRHARGSITYKIYSAKIVTLMRCIRDVEREIELRQK
jgi:hypothetical protein